VILVDALAVLVVQPPEWQPTSSEHERSNDRTRRTKGACVHYTVGAEAFLETAASLRPFAQSPLVLGRLHG
jgi:hypothetical protein